MTTYLLIRHAAHDLLGNRLAGRMPGVSLNATGQAEAHQLAERLARWPIAAIYSSPQPRAQQTAAPLTERSKLTIQTLAELDELDFGRWMGLGFAELENDPEWHAWNRSRSTARAPGGETMIEAQERALRGMRELEQMHPCSVVALVSHADLIKSALMGVLRLSLDEFHRFEISPSSVSIVAQEGGYGRVLLINGNGAEAIVSTS